MKLILIAVNSYWHYISWLLLTSVDVSRYIRNTEKMCKATDQNHHGSGKQCGHSGRRGFSLRYNAYCTLDTWHFCTPPLLLRTPVLNLGNCGLLYSTFVSADFSTEPLVSVDFCTQPSSLHNYVYSAVSELTLGKSWWRCPPSTVWLNISTLSFRFTLPNKYFFK